MKFFCAILIVATLMVLAVWSFSERQFRTFNTVVDRNAMIDQALR